MASTILLRNKACASCASACGRVTKAMGEIGEGPEYEAVWAYGAQCGVDNLEAISKANFICNKLGMDPITMGSTIGCAMELAELGSDEKKAGVSLHWGNAEAIVKLTEDTGYRRGFGDELALGSYRFAEKYGHPELSMSAKNKRCLLTIPEPCKEWA